MILNKDYNYKKLYRKNYGKETNSNFLGDKIYITDYIMYKEQII